MRIAVVAGEASGDLLGEGLVRALAARFPTARFEGIAGPRMQAAGCTSLYPMERLSVMGLAEVAARMPEVIRLRRRLARRLLSDPPAVFVGIDAPDFNLVLERRLRAGGVRTVHYVSPSVWAWRRYRLRKIRAGVDRMLVLFPFEADFYAREGIDARFVGHPLADQLEPVEDARPARARLGLRAEAPVVALLAGSRMTEVAALGDTLVETAHWLARRRPGIRFVVPFADRPTRERFQQSIDTSHGGAAFRLLDGDAHAAMEAADVVLLASGTATLEALLIGRPMVITYRTHPVTWAIGTRMVKLSHVGLPNLLAGRAVAPELLQDAATPRCLGAEVLALLDSPADRSRQRGSYRGIAATLRRGASERAAAAVAELVEDGLVEEKG
jgi:lipid-A-disaccharide synthase